jgi:hypothetical protein
VVFILLCAAVFFRFLCHAESLLFFYLKQIGRADASLGHGPCPFVPLPPARCHYIERFAITPKRPTHQENSWFMNHSYFAPKKKRASR